jgi:hypothetical protein
MRSSSVWYVHQKNLSSSLPTVLIDFYTALLSWSLSLFKFQDVVEWVILFGVLQGWTLCGNVWCETEETSRVKFKARNKNLSPWCRSLFSGGMSLVYLDNLISMKEGHAPLDFVHPHKGEGEDYKWLVIKLCCALSTYLLTHGSEIFLRSSQSRSYSRTSQHFIPCS